MLTKSYFKILFLIFVIFVTTTQTYASCSLQTGTESITVNGIDRDYEVYVPQGVSFPTSVLFAWHGIDSSPNDIEKKMKLKPQVILFLL